MSGTNKNDQECSCDFLSNYHEKNGEFLKSNVFEAIEFQGSSVVVQAKCVQQALEESIPQLKKLNSWSFW
jgi:hypothetical protein